MGSRSLIRAHGLALALVILAATHAFGADAAAFARQIATRYHIDARHVITADIDHDGDLDVLAATDGGFMVWVNDGRGRFTSEAPKPRPLVDGYPASKSWNGAEPRDEETIQSEVTSMPVVETSSQAPPDGASRSAVSLDAAACAGASRLCRIPRAPPVL